MLDHSSTKISYSNTRDLLDIRLKTDLGADISRKVLSKSHRQLENKNHLPQNLLVRHLLSDYTEIEGEDLATKIHLVSFQSGEIVCEPEDNLEYVYLPETAVFSQLSILEDGRTVETALVGNDGIIGISAVLGFNSINLWTQTVVSGTAYKICTQFFKKVLSNDLHLQSSFHNFVNLYIAQITQRGVCNNHHRLEERFSAWLLLLEDRIGTKFNNKIILTQEQIAQILGVHRPSITCIAQQFRDQGIIDYLRGRISILDHQKLQSVACECYQTLKREFLN